MLKKVTQPHQTNDHQDYRGVRVDLPELLQLAAIAKPLSFRHHIKPNINSAGGHVSSLKGRGMQFAEVRGYQPGDDIRCIDWRVTARTTRAHTKLYQEERERPVFCLVDYTASMYFGSKVAFKSVIAARIAAIMAWITVQQGDRFGGMIYTDQEYFEIRPQNKQRGLLPFFKLLASTELAPFAPSHPEPVFSKTLERLRHVIKPGSIIILISDFQKYDEQCERHLAALIKHSESIACRISDPLEHDLPPNNFYLVGDHDDHYQFDSSNNKLREHFRQQQYQQTRQVSKSLYHLNIPILDFSTANDPNLLLQQVFASSHRSRVLGLC